MTSILLILFIAFGFAFGRLSKAKRYTQNKLFTKLISAGQNISIIILLTLMGYKIASSEEVLNSFASIGLHSILFGFTTLLGSAAATFAIIKIYKKFAHPEKHKKLNIVNEELLLEEESHSNLHNFTIIGLYLLLVALGGMAAYFGLVNINAKVLSDTVDYSLFALVFFVGCDLGISPMTIKSLLSIGRSVLICCLGVVFGSLLGGLLIGIILGYDALYSLAIGSAMGWYSLSGVLLSNINVELGAMAFLSNLVRELGAMALVPVISIIFCPESAISACGATAMDTCLPAITKGLGREYILSGFACGIIISTIVPFFLSIIQFIYGIM